MHIRPIQFNWRKPLQIFVFGLLFLTLPALAATPVSASREALESPGPNGSEFLPADLPAIDLGYVKHSYLKASNTQTRDYFGWAVALDGNTLAVSAYAEDSASPGVNGDQEAYGANQSGAVYVFTFDGKTWAQQAYVKASNPGLEDYFGWSLALSGDTLVVGCPRERSANGDQEDNSAAGAGAVYVFTRDAGVWSQQAYLKASNIDALDYFGASVDVDGDTLVVGAYEEDGSATGVNGVVNNSTANAGAAYVFTRSGGIWSQQAYLKASNTGEGDKFGDPVAISGDTIVVGTPTEDSSATGVNGNQGNNSAADAGAVYVFTRSGETWSQQAYLKASNTDPGDLFGYSVAVEGDNVLVGARYEDSRGADESNNQFTNSGAAYLFARSGDAWAQQAYLKASNAQNSDRFGHKVAISGDMLLVSASGEASNATGVDGNQLNNSIPNAGAVYVFDHREGVWSQKAYLKQFPSGQGQDNFGSALAISGATVLVGAYTENSNATGVDGDQMNILAPDAGAAYTYVADLFFKDSYE